MPDDTKEPLIERVRRASTIEASTERFKRSWTTTDEDWHLLKQLSGMSDDDRVNVDNDLRLYRTIKSDQLSQATYTPSEARDQLLELAAAAFDLHEDIERALDNDKAGWALTTPGDRGWEGTRLFALSSELVRFAQLSVEAAERCGRARPGPSNDNLHELIESLARRWADSTGLEVSIANKLIGPGRRWNALAFIIKALVIADPTLKGQDQRITDIVKVKARRMRSEER